MHKITSYIKTYSLPILSGIFVGTTYIPFPPWALLFAYAPLWIFAFENRNDLRKVFWGGWWTQFVLSMIGFYWVYGTSVDFGGLPRPVALLALLLFSSFIHLYIPFSLSLSLFISRRWKLAAGMSLILIAISHSLFERFWPSLFSWHLGYTLLWARWPAYQWADTIGFLGLSTFILFFNALFAKSFLPKEISPRHLKPAALAILIFALLNWTGYQKGKQLSSPDRSLQVLAVQANIGNFDRYFAERGAAQYQSAILDKFIQQTQAALQSFPEAEVLAWPESAIPEYLDQNYLGRPNGQKLVQFLNESQLPLMTGAFSKEASIADKDLSTFNAFFVLQQKEGSINSQVYRKTHLLAFGEYLPLSSYFPILLKWLPFVSNFGRGNGPQILELQTSKDKILVGAQICYEGLYHNFSLGLADLGAQVLVNVTNDSWFGRHSEPEQHMMMTLSRAVETRRPLLRVTNTGITSGILANGELLQRSPLFAEWAGLFKINYFSQPEQTLYMKLNPWDSVLLVFIYLIILFYGAYVARTSKP